MPPLHFGRRPSQSNYPSDTVLGTDSRTGVRIPMQQEWYFKGDSTEASAPVSQSPTYSTHATLKPNIKL